MRAHDRRRRRRDRIRSEPLQKRRFRLERRRHLHPHQHPLTEQPLQHRQHRQLVERGALHHLRDRPLPVAEADDAVHFVGQIGEPPRERGKVDAQHRVQRQLFGEPPKLVHAPHRFGEQRLRSLRDLRLALDRHELRREGPLLPAQQAIKCGLARQRAGLRIDHLPFAHEDLPGVLILFADDQRRARVGIERLDQIDEPHLADLAGDRPLRAALRELLLLAAGQEHLDAGGQLLDEQRLAEKIVGARFVRAQFQRRFLRGGDQDHRRSRQPRIGAYRLAERDSIGAGQRHIGEQKIRRSALDAAQRIAAVGRGRHLEAGFAQRHIEDAKASGVGVGDEQALLGQVEFSREGASQKRA